MKTTSYLLLSAFALLSASPAAAQGQRGPTGLARVRATFRAADTSGDGKLDAVEALRAKIPSADFAAQDADRDRALSAEEFVVYYRQLLDRAGRPIPADVVSEVSRIRAARTKAQEAARKAEKARETRDPRLNRESADSQGPGAGRRDTDARLKAAREALEADKAASRVRTDRRADARGADGATDKKPVGDVPARRAQQLVKRLGEQGRVTPAEARAMYQALLAPNEPGAPATAAELRAALAAARPRVGTLVQEGHLTAEEGRALSQAFNERATAAAKQFGEPIETGTGPKDQAVKGGEVPARRAQQLVKGLVDKGRITAEEARTMYKGLLAAGEPGAAASLDELREALAKARPRIGELVKSGALTAEEGRALSQEFDARASAAARESSGPGSTPVRAPERGDQVPDKGKGVEAKTPARRAQQLVKGLVDKGRITGTEARQMYMALLAPGEEGAATYPQELRDALAAARPRLGALVQAGELSAEEARALSQAFDTRATEAAQLWGERIEPTVPEGDKPERRPADEPPVRKPVEKPDEKAGEKPPVRRPDPRPPVRKPVDPPKRGSGN